ncbi:hypothetical protein C2S52_019902 [Perilla frutescens var. hirtella]|nr:hypothetical protein C2S52_019902 [Perilla frutescens var. hirtella]
MMYEQQQQVRINMRSKRQIEVDKRRVRIEDLDEDSNKLEIVDLSGMSLDSLPNPPLNLAAICKLDLSNNNLQIPSRIERKLQQVEPITRYNRVRATKPEKAIGELKQASIPPSVNLPLDESPSPGRSAELPPIPPRRPRKSHQPRNPKHHGPARLHRLPQEAAEAERRRQPARVAAGRSHGAGAAHHQAVSVRQHKRHAQKLPQEELVVWEAGQVWNLQWFSKRTC